MENVSKFFKEEKDPFYQKGVKKGREEGIEQGIEQGIERGIERGIEQGVERGRREVVQNLIIQLGLSDEQTARVAGVTIEFVKDIRTSLLEK